MKDNPPRNLSKCDGGKAHRWKTFQSGIVRCIHCEMDGKEHARLAYLYQLEKSRWVKRINKFRAGQVVTVPIKNRWGINCAATIEAVYESSVDATVWNMDGPGGDRLVTGIPFSVITP